jgi:dsDNA-specific endonuclease/ATPase MutS2
MNAKLTLSLDRVIIEQAKEFARSRHKSLSKLIETYLRQVSQADETLERVTPLVARLSGVIDAGKLGNHKSAYSDYLTDKYR